MKFFDNWFSARSSGRTSKQSQKQPPPPLIYLDDEDDEVIVSPGSSNGSAAIGQPDPRPFVRKRNHPGFPDSAAYTEAEETEASSFKRPRLRTVDSDDQTVNITQSRFGRISMPLQALKNWVQGIAGSSKKSSISYLQPTSPTWKEIPTASVMASSSQNGMRNMADTRAKENRQPPPLTSSHAPRPSSFAVYRESRLPAGSNNPPVVDLSEDSSEAPARFETPSSSISVDLRSTPLLNEDEATGTVPVQSMSIRSCRTEDRWARRSGSSQQQQRSRSLNASSIARHLSSAVGGEKVINLEARDRYKRLLEEVGSGNVYFTSPKRPEKSLKRLAHTEPISRICSHRDAMELSLRTKELLDSVILAEEEEQSTPPDSSTPGTPALIDLVDEPPRPIALEQPRSSSDSGSGGRMTPRYDQEQRKDLNRRLAFDVDASISRARQFGPESDLRRRRAKELSLESTMRERARHQTSISLEEQLRLRLRLEGVVLYELKEEVDEFPELSDEAEETIKRVWSRGNEEELIAKIDQADLKRKDVWTLKGLDWLNDEVINFYIGLVAERSKNNKDLPKIYAFSSFFYTQLLSKGYTAVKRWTKKVNIFSFDLVLIPVHLGAHWCLAVIDFRHKLINYFDSMGGNNLKCLTALKQYLEAESMDKRKQNFDASGWKFEHMKNIPQQMNGSDCGVFTCKFAEFVSRDAEIVFTQENMPYYRRRMVFELCRKELM